MKKNAKKIIIVVFILLVIVVAGCLLLIKTTNKNLAYYRAGNVVFQFPSTVEQSGIQGFEGGFDHAGRYNELHNAPGDFDYIPEIQFIDNSDQHISSVGKIKQQSSIKIGKYLVTKIIRDVESQENTGYWADWGNYPICTIQYHLFDGKYIFCQDYWNDVTDGALEIMIKTFKVKR